MFPSGFNRENLTENFEILPEIVPESNLSNLKDALATLKRPSTLESKPERLTNSQKKHNTIKPIQITTSPKINKTKKHTSPSKSPSKTRSRLRTRTLRTLTTQKSITYSKIEKLEDLQKSYLRKKRMVYGHKSLNPSYTALLNESMEGSVELEETKE